MPVCGDAVMNQPAVRLCHLERKSPGPTLLADLWEHGMHRLTAVARGGRTSALALGEAQETQGKPPKHGLFS